VRLLFLQTHRETDRFFAASGVQLAQQNCGLFHFRCTTFSVTLKAKVGCTLAKVSDLRINLNVDGSLITSKTHTHPSHSQTSRLLTSSLSLGVPVPRENPEYSRCVDFSSLVFSLLSHRHSYIGLVFRSRFLDS
jgi:hypothetical protein